MSDSKFTLDASQAFSTLDGLNRAIGELESRFKRLPSAVRESFRPNISGNFVSQVKSADQAAEGLKKELEGVSAKNASAFNDDQVKDYAKALASAETAADGLKKASGDMERLNQFAGTGRQLFQGLLGVAGGIGAALSLGEAIRSGVDLNREYENVRTSLEVMLGSAKKADALLGRLNRFSAQTPFTPEQVNDAAKSLLAFGFTSEELIDRLREIGTVSAATGADFSNLATIIGKAKVANTVFSEDLTQLAENGIPVLEDLAKQFGVSESQVRKLASEGKISFSNLQAAFTSLTSEGGKFNGLLERQSQTLDGVSSTLKGLLSQRLRDIFAPLAESLKNAKKAIIDFLEPLRAATSEFDDQSKRVSDLERELVPLLSRYDQLTRATTPTKEEQEELAEVIKQIGILTPGAITEINKYGEALSINAEKSKELLDAERARLKFVNAEAIKAVKAAKEQAEQEVKILQARIKSGKQVSVQSGAGGGGLFGAGSTVSTVKEVDLTAKEIQEITNRVAELTEKAKGAAAELKRLRGEDIPDPEKVKPKPGGTGGTGGGSGGGGGTGKGKSAADLEFERREQDLQKRRLLLNDLEDGLDKELEIIRLHFDSLKLEYEKAGLDISGLIAKQADAEINAISESLIKQVEADSEAVERRKKAGLAYVDSQKAELEAQKALRESEILLTEEGGKRVVEAMRLRGAKEREIQEFQRDFDREIQRQRLEAELAFQQALLAITDTGNAQQVQEITNRIELIKSQLETLRLSGLKAQDTKKRTLLDLLGIDINSEDGQRALQTLEEAGQRIVSSIQSITQARVEAAEAEVGIADQRVQEAEDALDREIELAQAGFANNVDLRRRELEDAKKAREQAVKQQQAALRTQLAVDTAVQASNIITSTTNLIKSWSTLPFGVGLISAAAQIAGIFALITNIKSRAAAITGRARYGADGHIGKDGIVRGRMHSQGGEKLEVERGELVQVLADGTKKRVHVIRRENVQQYSELLRAANSGDKEKMATEALKMADISSLPASIQNRIFSAQLNTQALSERTSTYYQSTPTLSRHAVAERVFHTTNNNTTVVQAADNTRTNEILLKMLEVMMIKPKEQWSADGKTRWRGNVKTKFT